MKVLRYLSVLFSISVIMMMQACGSGGTSDTAGALTLSSPTVSDNGDGTSLVTVTATYAPPANKLSAQGVVISISATDNFGNTQSVKDTLSSGSNTVIQSFIIQQQLSTSTRVVITASIGGMTSGVLAIVPKATPTALAVTISTINFLFTDVANAFKDIAFTGGVQPYAVTSSVPADIIPNVSVTNSFTSGGNLRVTLVKAAVFNKATSARLTLTDKAGASIPITVNYFK